MSRFENSVQNLFQAVTMTIGIAGAAPYILQSFGLDVTLLSLLIILGAVNLYLIYALKSDVASRFSDLRGDVISGIEDVESLVDEDPDGVRTDGSGWQDIPQLSAEKVEMTGIPSTAGAALGGAIGALFSPAGAAAGALVGAAVAGGKEYTDLKQQHQSQLRRLAKEAVQIKTHYHSGGIAIDDVDDTTDGVAEFWQFTIRDRRAELHLVRINKQDGSILYKKSSESPEI